METLDVHFPRAGLDLNAPFGRQPAREVAPGVWGRTCRVGVNVRSFDPRTNRLRGGSRSGVGKLIFARVGGLLWVVQAIDTVVTTSEAAMQTSQSGRVVNLIAVSYGLPKLWRPGDAAYTDLTNNTGETPPLNITGLVFSAANNQRLYFADGINWCYADPITGTVEPWRATAGSLPVDDDNNTPRLIANYRGRIVLSGLLGDPQVVFASRVDDPTDFDYAPSEEDPTQAWALQTGLQGTVGDVVTCLIPYSDDILVIGCAHSIWMLRGDPGFGGTKDLVSDGIGIGFGKPWAKDPAGNLYFFSNRTGIFVMRPGQGAPVRLSGAITQELLAIDTGGYSVSMAWDDAGQRLHVFVTSLLEPTATRHFCWEERPNAWWVDVFKNKNHDPLCCLTLDGNESENRVIAIGSWDGYVRVLSPTAEDDDGYAIESEVLIGPINTKLLDEMKWEELQAVMAEDGGSVAWSIYAGRTAEAAIDSTPAPSGTFATGRSPTHGIRRAAHALYVKLSSTVLWSIESLRIVVGPQGGTRRRGY